ncbi:GTPase activating protein [Dinochytrium kinnereticum]|nr:GTPase activating protein [Dinochytrium kinnereticum]
MAAATSEGISLRLLWAKSNVSTRFSETSVSLGFLFLAHHQPQHLQMLDLSAESPTVMASEEPDLLTSDSGVTASEGMVVSGESGTAGWESVGGEDVGKEAVSTTTGEGKKGRETVFWGFLAKKDIVRGDLAVFREAAVRTRNAAKASPYDIHAELMAAPPPSSPNDGASPTTPPPQLPSVHTPYPVPESTQTITLPITEDQFSTLTSPTPPLSSFHTDLSTTTGILLAPLSSITAVYLDPILTLTPDGDSACLVRLGIDVAGEPLPDLWFERDEVGHGFEVDEVLEEMRRWVSSVGRVLVKPLDSFHPATSPSSTTVAAPTSAVTSTPVTKTVEEEEEEREQREKMLKRYLVVERGSSIALASLSIEAVQRGGVAQDLAGSAQRDAGHLKGEWPMSLPISQSSLIYKVGAFGFGVAAAVVGPTISNKVEDITRSAAWDVMERFSRVTKFAQTTTKAEALLNDYDSAGHYLAQWAGELQGRFLPSGGAAKKGKEVGKAVVVDRTRDFEVLAIGRSHHRTKKPLCAEDWILLYDDVGKLTKPADEIKALIFYGGVDDDLRSIAWKYLLKVYPWDSTERDRHTIMEEKTRIYVETKMQWKTILADATQEATNRAKENGGGVVDEETEALAGDEKEEGDVVTKIKERRYRVEKDVVRTDRTVPFFAGDAGDDRPLSTPAPSVPGQPAVIATQRLFSRNLEMLKDVLITYTVYNFELGYVQGMNDLLAPVLAVMRDEVDGFWCFAEFMEDMKVNFYRDQSGMRQQLHLLELLIKFVDPPLYAHLERIDSVNLFCCFRWMLVLFKREFAFDDVLRLWEVLWACPFTKRFHLFVALAILNKYRQEIMTNCKAFDECLKFTNDLSGNLDLEDLLSRSEVLFQVFRQMITIAAWERLGVNIELGLSRPDTALPSSSSKGVPAPRPESPQPKRGRSASNASASVRSTSASPSRLERLAVPVEVDVEGIWDLLGLLEVVKG